SSAFREGCHFRDIHDGEINGRWMDDIWGYRADIYDLYLVSRYLPVQSKSTEDEDSNG
ncbi:hypothetical protein PPYR_15081, partial [Photinus pyralis]